jgi:hypothetical protein
MMRGKPRAAQINRQITKTAPKMALSIFSVTDLKDIALSPLSDLANIAPQEIERIDMLPLRCDERQH